MNQAPPAARTTGLTTALRTMLGLGATTLLLSLAGRTLPFPSSWAPADLRHWAGSTDPAVAAFTALRALAVALVAWVALTWLLAVFARLARIPAAVRAADGLTLPFVRRLAEATAGAALVAVSLVPATQAGAATLDPSPPVVMSDLGPTSPGTTTTSTTTLAPTTTPTVDAATTSTTTPTIAALPPSMTALDEAPEPPLDPRAPRPSTISPPTGSG